MTKRSRTKVLSEPFLGDLSGPFLLSLLAGDGRGVSEVFETAVARGADLALVARDLISPSLHEVGEMWVRGDVSEAEEHLATALVATAFARLSASVPHPEEGAPRLVLLCVAGEFHALGIGLVADVARSVGWEVEVLGANVPRRAAVSYVVSRPPRAVGLSVALAGHVPECARTVEEIRRGAPGTKVLVGGLALRRDPELGKSTLADACFTDAVSLRKYLVSLGRVATPPSIAATVAPRVRKRARSSAG